jgi:heat shock protein HslJ
MRRRPESGRRILATALAALLPVAVAVACESDTGGAGGAPTTTVDPGAGALEGTTFTSTSVTEDGAARPLASSAPITITFDQGVLRWRAGCNSFGGPAVVDGDRLRLGDEVGGTAMGCAPALQAQDDWLVGFLRDGPTWTVAGDELTLTSGGTTIRLTSSGSASAVPLIGTAWTLETISDGRTASSVPEGVAATLSFSADGTVTGTGTCNGYSATSTVSGDSITFVPGPTTLIGCSPAETVVEQAVQTTLVGTVRYAIDHDRLTLERPDGSSLTYRAG